MKAAFRHILLAALLIRALMPLGWMPGQAQLGQAAFIICAADGSIQHGTPGKDGQPAPHQPCAFGAAMQLLDIPQAASITPPALAALVIASAAALPASAAATRHTPQAPRAPPFFA